MSREIRNLGASVLDRLRNKAKEMDRPFDWILQYYASERFLYRISQSDYWEKFILKGGLVYFSWNLPLRRHTRDIDFRAFTSSNRESVAQIIRDVCNQPVEADAVEFLPETIDLQEIFEEKEYPGIRVRLWARIGDRTRVRMQIDLGFSDEITPKAEILTFPTFLNMPAPRLYGYPKEMVVAEKFHILINRGSATSRVKDFYDLWFVSEHSYFDGAILQEAIINTFNNRNTSIPEELPVVLSDNYAKEKAQQWKAFLDTFNPGKDEIQDFKKVLKQLREFLMPVVYSTAKKEKFDLNWTAGRGWYSKED